MNIPDYVFFPLMAILMIIGFAGGLIGAIILMEWWPLVGVLIGSFAFLSVLMRDMSSDRLSN